MARFTFDWKPVIPDYSDGLDRLYRGLENRRNRQFNERKLAMDADSDRLRREEYKRQNDLNERREAAREEREKREFELRLSDRNRTLTKSAIDAYREGGESEAEATLAGASFVDPKTGEARSVRLNRGAPPPSPYQLQAPTREPSSIKGFQNIAGKLGLFNSGDKLKLMGEEAPAAPEQSSTKGLQTLMGLRKTDAAPVADAGDSTYDQLRATGTRPSIELPNGERVEFDPGEREAYQQRKREEKASRLEEMLVDPRTPPDARKDIAALLRLMRAGATNAESAVVTNAVSREDAQTQAASEGDKNRTSRERVAATRPRGRGSRGAGGDNRPAGTEDLKELGRIEDDSKKMDEAIRIIQADPGAWNEYRSNLEGWRRQEVASQGALYGTGRRILQGAGFANISPDQGLNSRNARRLHQIMSSLENSIAKGYGGAITDSDRDASRSEISSLSANHAEAIQTLLGVKNRLQTNRDLFLGNKKITVPQRPTAQASEGVSGSMERLRALRTQRGAR